MSFPKAQNDNSPNILQLPPPIFFNFQFLNVKTLSKYFQQLLLTLIKKKRERGGEKEREREEQKEKEGGPKKEIEVHLFRGLD